MDDELIFPTGVLNETDNFAHWGDPVFEGSINTPSRSGLWAGILNPRAVLLDNMISVDPIQKQKISALSILDPIPSAIHPVVDECNVYSIRLLTISASAQNRPSTQKPLATWARSIVYFMEDSLISNTANIKIMLRNVFNRGFTPTSPKIGHERSRILLKSSPTSSRYSGRQ